jgi:WD40 repeat protein
MAQTARLAQLLENLVNYFDLEELRTLCFNLDVNYDNLGGEGIEAKARELLGLLDRSGRIPEFIETCAKLRPNIAWQEILKASEAPSPFKGLQYFDEADAALFFGRELLTAKLVARLAPSPVPTGEGQGGGRFLAVVGASGSGKSSVVRAGLVPALRRGEQLADDTLSPEGSTRWPVHVITPTHHPLESLAASLTRDSESVTATATLMDDLARDPRSLHLYARKLLARDEADHLLLVVDQFEELYTACKDEALRRAFVDNLLYAAGLPSPQPSPQQGEGVSPLSLVGRGAGGEGQSPEGPTLVVIALRADFYAHCAQYANLREALAQHQEFIGPMTSDELRRAIEEPAHRNGWEYEAGLVDLLLRDVGDEPGALPLLSHALLETWKRRQGRMLTLEGYHASGGVRGAIAKTADDVYSRLTPDQQVIARNIFLQLTELGEGTQDTRRRAALAELVPREQDKPAIEAVVKLLADARLVTTEKDVAQVAHEALIREWPALRKWLDENREGLRIHRDLTQAAQDWASHDKEASYLYRGARLAQALETFRVSETLKVYGALNTLEHEFLDASKTLAEREQAEREAARQRELQAAQKLADEQKRRRQGLQRLAVALGVLLLVAIAAVMVASQQRNAALGAQATAVAEGARADHERDAALNAQATAVSEGQRAEQERNVALNAQATAVAERDRAEAQSRIALSRQLAAQAMSLVEDQFDLSALLSMEAITTADTVEARNVLLTALQAHPQLFQYLRGYTTTVSSVAFSPDGKLLASGSGDKTIILWDVATRQPLGQPLKGHTAAVLSVAFSPDGKTLASGSDDHTIILWDVTTRQPLGQPLKGHTAAVLSVAFSPDGKTLASGYADTTIILWDVATRQPLGQPLKGHTAAVESVAFSPDGKLLASGSYDTTIILWNVATRQPLGQPLKGHTAQVFSVAFSPDGKSLASGSEDGTIILWDVATRQSVGLPLKGHNYAAVWSVTFSPDGKTLASGSRDKTIILWNVATGQPLGQRLKGHTADVLNVAFSPDGKTLASGSGDKTIILWDVAARQPLGQLLKGHPSLTYSMALSPDGKTLASSQDRTIVLWNVATGQLLGQPLKGHTAQVFSVAFSPDGKLLASGSGDTTIILWDVAARQPLGQPLQGHTDSVLSVAFSPDGKTLASGSEDNTIILWDVATRQPLGQPLKGHTADVESVAFSPDGKSLASGSYDTTIILWNVATRQPLGQPLKGHTHAVWSVTFSPDGKLLASGSWDKTIILWNVATGQPLGLPLKGHTDWVLSVDFAPDGKTLASGSRDNTIILWDVATRQSVGQPLQGHTDDVLSVAFSPDGKTLASGYADTTIILWDVSVESWEARACRMVNRNLTPEEWAQYLPGQPYHKTCPNLPEGQ